jgi:hypothetical protein
MRSPTSTAPFPSPRACNSIGGAVIYCVVPEEMAGELFDKLADYYADDPNVTVIVDRRKSSRRGRGSSGGGKRELRDRRRPRVTGELPELNLD